MPEASGIPQTREISPQPRGWCKSGVELPQRPDGTSVPKYNVDRCEALHKQYDDWLLEDLKECVTRKAIWMYGDKKLGMCLMAQLHLPRARDWNEAREFDFHPEKRSNWRPGEGHSTPKDVLGKLAGLGSHARALFMQGDCLFVMKYVEFNVEDDYPKGLSLGIPLLYVLVPEEEWYKPLEGEAEGETLGDTQGESQIETQEEAREATRPLLERGTFMLLSDREWMEDRLE